MRRNDRLRSTLRANTYSEETLADELGVDRKTVQRWVTQGRTPHRNTAQRAANLLNVPADWLWPELEQPRSGPNPSEVIALYPHRFETPKHLWFDLIVGAQQQIDLFANASLFLPEENPEAISIIKHKATNGTKVRILMGDPDSPAMELRGREERLFDAIPARIRMALAYYRPLTDVPGIEFHLHQTSLYNSIFRFDNQMLVNQHVYGTYGYMAPILHLRSVENCDLFDTYARSFELVWSEESYPIPNRPTS
ncbi:MAG: helix-turn-helix domain-containing protein [Pseudonocardiaceae bacterium]